MSNATINQSYVDAFRANVYHLAQQVYSRLRMCVDADSQQAETGSWDRLSAADSVAKTRKMATPEGGRVWSRRIAVALPFNDAEITEIEDPSMMIADPNSNIVKSLGMSFGRRFDDLIIGAATGTALDGEGNSNVFPAGQIVSDYSVDINFDLITQIQEQFLNNDIELDVPKYAVVGPRQVRQLLNTTEATSSDYVRGKLEELSSTGIVPGWMGFNWIMSTRLLEPATDQRDCLFFTETALGLHVPMDMVAFVERDPSLSYAWRPYAEINAGAIRIQDEQIIWLKARDTSVA